MLERDEASQTRVSFYPRRVLIVIAVAAWTTIHDAATLSVYSRSFAHCWQRSAPRGVEEKFWSQPQFESTTCRRRDRSRDTSKGSSSKGAKPGSRARSLERVNANERQSPDPVEVILMCLTD